MAQQGSSEGSDRSAGNSGNAGAAQHGSLYRRHRPRTFDDVVGQEHVVRTLRNAVERGNVHHAYLFVGSRGTGKTSMAKILACALNCEGGPRVDFSPDDPACIAIANGTSLDVVEMDAASHNSVDDIRDLRERIGLMPGTGGWRVYILDEAHMLSTAAWNAFLKTLEEPPPNTVFVLATTEAHKVLATIADRCHRFDFRPPTVDQLSTVLRRVAGAESITIDDQAVAMIARSANGSFRDALGTLEQLVTYGGDTVDTESVQAVLGVADFDQLEATAGAIAAGDRPAVLAAVAQVADSGRDLVAFAGDLAVHVRNLLVAQTLDEVPDTIGLTQEQAQRLLAQSQQFGPERVAHTLELVSRAIAAARGGADPRLQLELALFKAARPADDGAPDALLARIEALENAAGPNAPVTPVIAQTQESKPVAAAPIEVPDDEPTVSAVADPPPIDPGPDYDSAPDPEPESRPSAATGPVFEPDEEAPYLPAPSIDEVTARWPDIVSTLETVSPRLATVLASARPIGVEGHKLQVGFAESESFSRKTAESPANRDHLADAVRSLLQAHVVPVVVAVPDDEFVPAGTKGGANGESDGLDPDELIAKLKEEFDAKEKFE
jgi:DNA polymerase-3 subunit gamma/tau